MDIQIVDCEKDKNFFVISVDHLFWRKICKKVFAKSLHSLTACQSSEELENLIHKIERKTAKNFFLNKLSLKRCFSAELQWKIQPLAISSHIIAEEIKQLQRLGYLNDEQCLDLEIQKYIARGKGPHWIAMKLEQLCGIGKEQIVLRIQTAHLLDQKNAIVKVLSRRFKRDSLDNTTTRNKAWQFLMRRGFPTEMIRETLDEYIESNN